MLVLLDSTVLIDYLRGRSVVARVRGLRRGGDVPCTTGINVEEVVRGRGQGSSTLPTSCSRGSRSSRSAPEEGWRAGTWRREFTARGVTLWQADCLIAAAALGADARLATGNHKDFPMPELAVEHWPAGE